MSQLQQLFRRDPTRELEEVQKVNAREQAASDVEEFYETESARRVLSELGEVIETHPGEAPRFLYLHATFGSGKTHLLKLIGFLTDTDGPFTHLGRDLAQQWPGFDTLSKAIEDAHVDRLKPVFLNLLDRDASKEPPLPYLIFEAIGRELGYPTDPNWLLEWAWTVDTEHEGIWESIQDEETDGMTFQEALNERAPLRRWLYRTVPNLPETNGTDLDTEEGVKASIEEAERGISPESFDPTDLVDRVRTATDALSSDGEKAELLLGLDEVALFVGDSRHRYREFEETMEALQRGPNPPVVTTGQYSLPATRKQLIGQDAEDHWSHQQVLLEGADTEIIVRKRWLQKDEPGSERVSTILADAPNLDLESYTSVGSEDPDPIESYPFREYDLTLLRRVMQELITEGRTTDREYIQGRALLVLVRSLFTKFGWASKPQGAIVPWDQLFDLLVEETTYVPLWVQEMITNTLVPTFGGEDDAWQVRVAKALYLLNQVPAVPATPENLGRLMVNEVDDPLENIVAKIESALNELVDKQKVLTETNERGDDVYTLVSEEQGTVLNRAQENAERLSPHQVASWLGNRLRESDGFFRSPGSRHEANVGNERLVPLRFQYSVLDPVDRAPNPRYDAIRVRILAEEPDTLEDQIQTWKDVNDGRDGGEHVLIAIEAGDAIRERIREVIGMGQALNNETESHPELDREYRANKRRLESSVQTLLEEASVHTVHHHEGKRPRVLETVIEDQVQAVFGSSRKVLSRPLVEVDDAKQMARFFQGGGDWPLADRDAVMLGVDRSTHEIASEGWCREFIEIYEPQTAVDVETLLQQTRTANGDYRGSPQESIEALLLTLATSNEAVALKQDTDYVTDPAEIGRKVRTKGGLTSLQVRFGIKTIDTREVRQVATTLLGRSQDGDDPDAWIAELETWAQNNSVQIKRTLKGAAREFSADLEALEAALADAFGGGEFSTTQLLEDEVRSQAETFADAHELFAESDGEAPLWDRFAETLEFLEQTYPSARVTSQLQATAETRTVPSTETVRTRLEEAENHRETELASQYERITGSQPATSDPDEIREDLTAWIQDEESTIHTLLEGAQDTFDDLSLDRIEASFETVWAGETLRERDLVDRATRQQARTYETIRSLLQGDPSPWDQLEEAARTLRSEHPDSPTTEAVESLLTASHPPSLERVNQVLEEAEDPQPPGADDDAWSQLQRVAGKLQQDLPHATVTDKVSNLVDEEERPSEETATELLDEAETLLERLRTVQDELDEAEDGTIVLIDPSDD